MLKRDVKIIDLGNEVCPATINAVNMKEAIVSRDLTVSLQDVDFPTLPSPNHLVIKVHVSGANPKDWAMAERC